MNKVTDPTPAPPLEGGECLTESPMADCAQTFFLPSKGKLCAAIAFAFPFGQRFSIPFGRRTLFPRLSLTLHP